MKLLKTKTLYTIASTLALGLLVSFAAPQVASAIANDNDDSVEIAEQSDIGSCYVKPDGTHNGSHGDDAYFSIAGDVATIKFSVVGGADCSRIVALKAYYTVKEGGNPHDQQQRIEMKQQTFTPGKHRMSINLPGEKGCYYQIDFVRVKPNAPEGERSRMLAYALGGDHTCIQKDEPEQPIARCDKLTGVAVDVATRNYRYDLSYTEKNGAKLQTVTYNFGDTTILTGVTPAQLAAVRHTYKTAGTYTVTAQLTFNIKGVIKKVPCVTTVKPTGQGPAFACTALKSTVVDEKARSYKFTVEYVENNGPTLNYADINFGDGVILAQQTKDKLTDIPHTYATAGTYTASATLNFTVDGKVQQVSCSVPVTFQGVPACTTVENLPKDSPDCIKLVSTGPTQTIGLVVGVILLSSAGYYIYLRRRNA